MFDRTVNTAGSGLLFLEGRDGHQRVGCVLARRHDVQPERDVVACGIDVERDELAGAGLEVDVAQHLHGGGKAQAFQQRGHAARLAQRLDTQRFQRMFADLDVGGRQDRPDGCELAADVGGG